MQNFSGGSWLILDLVTEFARRGHFFPSVVFIVNSPEPGEGDEIEAGAGMATTARRLRAGPSGLVALVYIRLWMMG